MSSGTSKRIRCLALLAALLCLAAQAQAGPKMYYEGSLKIEGYGNTILTGYTRLGSPGMTPTWTQSTFLGEPLERFCNYKNPTKAPTACASSVSGGPPPTGTRCFISTRYPAPKESLVTNCGTSMAAVPITGQGIADVRTYSFMTAMGATACAGGCNASTQAVIMPGAIPTTTPSGEYTFVGPGWGIHGMGSGSFNTAYPYNILYSVTYLTQGTGPGTFFPGGGPGNISAAPAAPHGGFASITAGGNQFGGTMRLLGGPGHSVQFYDNGAYQYFNTSLKFLFDAAGASYRGAGRLALGGATTCAGVTGTFMAGKYQPPYITVMGGMTAKPTNPPFNPCRSATTDIFTKTDGMRNRLLTMDGTMYAYYASWLYKTAFPWTTGVAYVTAPLGYETAIRRTGYDNRTANGLGTIQLVTPQLTNWEGPFFNAATGGHAMLKIKFVPEPSEWLLLGSGVLSLGLLGRLRARLERRTRR